MSRPLPSGVSSEEAIDALRIMHAVEARKRRELADAVRDLLAESRVQHADTRRCVLSVPLERLQAVRELIGPGEPYEPSGTLTDQVLSGWDEPVFGPEGEVLR